MKKKPQSTPLLTGDQQVSKQADPTKPSLPLLCKIGSALIHAEEWLSPTGNFFDKGALEGLLADPEVKAWIKAMGPLLPVKR